MSKCIVTGGAGFIGSHLTDKLVELGNEVIVIDNLSLGKKDFINKNAEFYEFDITDFKKIKPLFEGVEVVFHVAAEPRMPLTIKEPLQTHNVNVNGTLNVLEASRLVGVKKVIFSSSAAVYGDIAQMPVEENVRLSPKSPYGLHKKIGEEYMRLYNDLYSIKTISLRYFNVYGPRKLTNGGYPTVIPIFMEQRKEGKKLTIFGNGKNTRDYVHVFDVVEANIKAWKKDFDETEEINVGSGTEVSVSELADIIGGEKEFLPPREGDILSSRADITKAKELLGWDPKVTLEEGIAELKKEAMV